MPDYSKFRISLPEEYNMSAADFGRVQLVNVPAWKAAYPKMYERYKAIGWTDDKLGKMTRGWAAWEDWKWGTSGLPFVAPNGTPIVCGSHRMVDFHKPWNIGVTHPLTQAFGRDDGYNSHPTSASGSEIDSWLDQYVDDPSATPCGAPHRLFDINVSSKYVGVMRTTPGQGEIPPSEKLNGNFIVDLSTNIRLNKFLTAYGSVSNIMNEVYAVARRPAGLGPGMPRSFTIGIKAML